MFPVSVLDVKKRLQHVINDAIAHFAHEEKLFKEWHYPDAEEHAQRHAEAIAAYKAVMKKFISYDMESEWIEAGQYVKDLLIQHLLNEDMKYAEFYQECLSRSAAPGLSEVSSFGVVI